VPDPDWTEFTRHDLAHLADVVRDVAASGDRGAHGHGVEVVIESPPLRAWQRWLHWRRPRERDRASIAVTNSRGIAKYPVHIRLYTTHGGDAGRKVDRRPGWTTSNTAGQAILMMKARAATHGAAVGLGTDPLDADELATGTVAALDDLHLFSPLRGWRFRVDRLVRRE
jgi:hypothetical protein